MTNRSEYMHMYGVEYSKIKASKQINTNFG